MAVITQDGIRELVSIRGERAPITSCYLDVDGRRVARYQDLEHEVDLLMREAKARANGEPSVQADLRRIHQLIRGGLDRSKTRGLAIFACSEQGLWEVFELPVPVRSQVVINQVPAVGQLESVVREHEPIGVLLADRQRARMFVFALGELIEHSERFDALPRDEGTRGERDRGGDHPHHLEERVQQHMRNAAQVAFEVWQQSPFGHFAIGAPDPLARELESNLHPYLVKRLAGRVNVTVGAAHDEVLAEAQSVEDEVERRRDAEVVARLREAVSTGRRGVAGLGPVLEALADRRVDHLLVSKGYSESGWRWDDCSLHAAMGRRCKRCNGQMVEVADIVEEAVEEALSQSCQVQICVANPDLDVMGRIGALLRY